MYKKCRHEQRLINLNATNKLESTPSLILLYSSQCLKEPHLYIVRKQVIIKLRNLREGVETFENNFKKIYRHGMVKTII
jgi:hypothetical protein